MPEAVIPDTSCLIVLTKIGELGLLQSLYGRVVTTRDIEAEFSAPLPAWISIEKVGDTVSQSVLELQLDKGEASAIALALERPDCILILDDFKARTVAKRLDLRVTGTIGILIKAKLSGIIPSIRPLLEKVKQTDFRLSNELEKEALSLAGE